MAESRALLLVAGLIVLASCGGGESKSPAEPPATTAPASTTTTAAKLSTSSVNCKAQADAAKVSEFLGGAITLIPPSMSGENAVRCYASIGKAGKSVEWSVRYASDPLIKIPTDPALLASDATTGKVRVVAWILGRGLQTVAKADAPPGSATYVAAIGPTHAVTLVIYSVDNESAGRMASAIFDVAFPGER